ncbi:MAG: cobalamin-binding protein [Chloroflexaceae bacterium]|nr:cobalamin-binding protein [Chloroflexaceae bacterium]
MEQEHHDDPYRSTLQRAFDEALLARDRSTLWRILEELSATHAPMDIIDHVVTPALEHIGAAWEEGTIALSQVYMSGRLCEEIIDRFFPHSDIVRADMPPIAIAVLHDYHVLGKRIVHSILRTLGYHIVDYGHGIEVDPLVKRVRQDQIAILLLSTLMLPSAFLVRDVSQQLKATNPHIKIIVGGAPFRFDDQLWQQVGADAMGRSASDAIGLIDRLRP